VSRVDLMTSRSFAGWRQMSELGLPGRIVMIALSEGFVATLLVLAERASIGWLEAEQLRRRQRRPVASAVCRATPHA
jgi:hypothetical protein